MIYIFAMIQNERLSQIRLLELDAVRGGSEGGEKGIFEPRGVKGGDLPPLEKNPPPLRGGG